MSKQSLDDRLFETIWPGLLDDEPLDMQQYMRNARQPIIDDVKRVFADEGYITPEQVAKTQELVNQMANRAIDMAKLPVTIHECVHVGANWTTGQEWYDRFKKELLVKGFSKNVENNHFSIDWIVTAARRAAGLQETEE